MRTSLSHVSVVIGGAVLVGTAFLFGTHAIETYHYTSQVVSLFWHCARNTEVSLRDCMRTEFFHWGFWIAGAIGAVVGGLLGHVVWRRWHEGQTKGQVAQPEGSRS